jgi:hypothetical protein
MTCFMVSSITCLCKLFLAFLIFSDNQDEGLAQAVLVAVSNRPVCLDKSYKQDKFMLATYHFQRTRDIVNLLFSHFCVLIFFLLLLRDRWKPRDFPDPFKFYPSAEKRLFLLLVWFIHLSSLVAYTALGVTYYRLSKGTRLTGYAIGTIMSFAFERIIYKSTSCYEGKDAWS